MNKGIQADCESMRAKLIFKLVEKKSIYPYFIYK